MAVGAIGLRVCGFCGCRASGLGLGGYREGVGCFKSLSIDLESLGKPNPKPTPTLDPTRPYKAPCTNFLHCHFDLDSALHPLNKNISSECVGFTSFGC